MQTGVPDQARAEVWFQVSVVGAPTVAVAVESVAEPLAAVAGAVVVVVAVVVTRPHSAAPPLLPSLPAPKTRSLEEGHRCRKEEKTQSEVAAASVVSSDLFSRLPGLVVRS